MLRAADSCGFLRQLGKFVVNFLSWYSKIVVSSGIRDHVTGSSILAWFANDKMRPFATS